MPHHDYDHLDSASCVQEVTRHMRAHLERHTAFRLTPHDADGAPDYLQYMAYENRELAQLACRLAVRHAHYVDSVNDVLLALSRECGFDFTASIARIQAMTEACEAAPAS